MAAFDRYAVAAAVAGCLEYSILLKHRDNVLQLLEECRAKGKPTAVALVYDELARKDWDRKAHSQLPGFNQDNAAWKLDKDVLIQAETKLEERKNFKGGKGDKGKGTTGGSYGKGESKGKAAKGHSKGDGKRKLCPWNKEYWEEKDERPAKAAKW